MKFSMFVIFPFVVLSGGTMSQAQNPPAPTPAAAAVDQRITMPGSPFGIANGFLYGYQGVKAYDFMPQLRQLGGGFTKTYLFWNQVEPKKGQYDWTAVDAFVGQLLTPEEGLLAVFSSSEWAVTRPSALLPPSLATNPDDYYRFVFDLVTHCKGRVRYWQNDAEPNSPIYWSGTKEQYVAELKVFYKAVKAADAAAIVVVGGYDGLFGPPGTHQFPNQQVSLDFFDVVLKDGHEAFDIFDLRLYGDPYTIVARVDFMRQKMRALGFDKPIICTEYGGPNLFEFPENRKYIPLVTAWSQGVTAPANGSASASGGANGVADLYRSMSTLAPQTQMFMQDCPPELDAKYQRIQARGIVVRNVLALRAGVQKTIYWYLPSMPMAGDARYNVMALMYGKIGMVELSEKTIVKRYPGADAFERMATSLGGVQQVTQIAVPEKPTVFLFKVDRGARGPVYVVWDRRDAFAGEDQPAVAVAVPWTFAHASASDAFGRTVTSEVTDHMLRLSVSDTSIFIEPGR